MNQNNTYNEMDSINTVEDPDDLFLGGLSPKEQRLYEILSEINSETLFGVSIATRLSNRSLRGFREMIKELYEQSEVAREELIQAIGVRAVRLIEAITLND